MEQVKDKFLHIRLPSNVHEELKKKAETESRTLANQVLHYIKEGLKK